MLKHLTTATDTPGFEKTVCAIAYKIMHKRNSKNLFLKKTNHHFEEFCVLRRLVKRVFVTPDRFVLFPCTIREALPLQRL